MNNANNSSLLPIVATLKQAVLILVACRSSIVRFGMPFVLLSIIYVIYTGKVPIQGDYSTFSSSIELFGFVLLIASMVLAIIGIHRTLLLEKNEIVQTKTLRWNMRESAFVLWWIFIGVAVVLCAIPFVFVIGFLGATLFNISTQSGLYNYLVWPASVFPAFYFFSRWILIMPATAIDESSVSFASAWSMSRNNGWRLFLLIGVGPLIFSLLLELIPEAELLLYNILVYLLWIVIGIIEVSVLSLSYKFLTENINRKTKNEVQY